MCRCVSIIPGITTPPVASTTCVPSGVSRSCPTAAIRSPTTRTSPPSRIVCESSIVSTVPPRSSTGRPSSGTGPSSPGFDTIGSFAPADTRPCIAQGPTINRTPCGVKTRRQQHLRPPFRVLDTPAARAETARHGSDICPYDGVRCAQRMTERAGVPGARPDGGSPGGPHAGPLAGLVVADFSRILAGPYATMLLADLGADVVKVEGPKGDDTRSWVPPLRGEASTYFLGVNRGKRSIALDLRDEADAAVARELARRAHGLRENFKPGGLGKYALDYPSVSATNPGVVYSSISGFGAGAGKDVPGYDLMVQAISGLMSLTGDPDGPPYRAGISVFDVMAGNHAVIGVLAALRHRDATGEGQHIEVNLLSSALTGLVNHSSAYLAGGVVPYRMGNAHPSVAPYEAFPTADREMIIAAANDRLFGRLCQVLGIPEVAGDPRFVRNSDRTANQDALRPILAERLATRGADEWFELLVDAGVPCGPVNTIDGGFAMAERLGLDPVVEVGEGERALPTARNPITFSRTPAGYRLPPPELDEHGAELRKWLES